MVTKKIIILSTISAAFALSARDNTYIPLAEFKCGSDVEKWVIDVDIGTPKKTFPLVLDTTSELKWVTGNECQSDFCQNALAVYDSDASSTAVNLNENVTLFYPEGSVEGSLYTDTICIGSQSSVETFSQAFNITGFEDVTKNFAGYFGVGLPEDYYDSYSYYAKRQSGSRNKGIFKKSSSNWKRATLAERNNVHICEYGIGINQDVIVGDFYWFDLPCKYSGSPSWKTDLKKFKIDGVIEIDLSETIASFDSSTDKIQIPKCELKEIYKSLHATKNQASGDYEFKCCEASDITFTLDKSKVTIPASTWAVPIGDGEYCTAKFEKSRPTTANPDAKNSWRLGQNFLVNFYQVFDPDRRQTGLALIESSISGVQISSA